MFQQEWCNQAVALMLGLLIGLLLGRLTRAMIALVTLGGAVAAALFVTGHGDILQQNIDVLPRALSLGTQVVQALRQILLTTPAALVGSLAGILLREVIRLAKS
jgi:hypothetical protein